MSEDEPGALADLELSVAGLVCALATVRIIPAASCRGHTGQRPWSEVPVVLFATTEYSARALQPLVEATGCSLSPPTVPCRELQVPPSVSNLYISWYDADLPRC